MKIIIYKKIKNKYKFICFYDEKYKGTYITSNTIMTISKYDHIMIFDSDDVMFPNLVQKVMLKNYDLIEFKMKNFYTITKKTVIKLAYGQFMINHWVFDYFGRFMPWNCSAYDEFKHRVKKFINVLTLNETLFLRNIHPESLTQSNKTNFFKKK